jgi:hypothetical protein
MEVTLFSWKYFSDYVNQELLNYQTYIYRGHGDASWKLEPTLDRSIKSARSTKRAEHLTAFKYAVRGRRGANPALLATDNDWWALGQHHGLETALLDWTESPFTALYFAAYSAKKRDAKHYCVWAISRAGIERVNTQILEDEQVAPVENRKPIVELVNPLTDENSRLVNQRGLFTRGPNNVDLHTWIHTYTTDDYKYWDLIKIIVPRSELDLCLRYLNRMNINHSTLFPDLSGACAYCNIGLTISGY